MINGPQVVDLKLGLHFFLAVKGYEGNFELVISCEVEGVVDLSDDVFPAVVGLPVATVAVTAAVFATGVTQVVDGIL